MLIFEMVAGHPPFYDEDRVRMFKNICSVKYSCPAPTSPRCVHPAKTTTPAIIRPPTAVLIECDSEAIPPARHNWKNA